MLPKKDRNALNVFALSIIITIIASIITLLIVANPFFNLAEILSLKIEKKLMLLFPLSVLLIGIFNSLYYLNNRKKQFNELAQTKVYRSISTAILNISLGMSGITSIGLIISNMIAQLFANINLFRHNMVLKSVCSSVNVVTMKKMLVR